MRVVIAEDSVLLREGLVRLLVEAGLDVVGEAGDADELLEAVHREQPDLVITDVRMPPDFAVEGTRAALEIRRLWPSIGIVILSQHAEPRYAVELLRDHPAAVGYLLKERVRDLDAFVDALRTVSGGGTVIDPEVVAVLLGGHRPGAPLSALSAREREVLALVAEGRSNAAIALQLSVTARTVETHVATIFAKLHLPESPEDHRRVLAVLSWLRTPQ